MTISIIQKLKFITKNELIYYLILLYSLTLSFPGEIKRLIAGLLIVIYLIDLKKKDSFINKEIKNIIIIFTLFLVYALFSFIWTEATFSESFNYIRKYWYLLPSLIIYKYINKEDINMIIIYFLAGIFISELLSYGNYFSFWQIGKGNADNSTVFIFHIFYSIFLAISSMILLIKFLFEKIFIIKIIYLLFLLIGVINLFINVGRTGQVSLFISIIFILFLHYRFKIIYLFFAILIIISTLSINYYFNPTFNERVNLIKSDIENIISKDNYNTSLGARIGFWIISKEILLDNDKNLFFGVGVNQNMEKMPEIVNNKYPYLFYNKDLPHFHNTYLEIITQFVIVGLMLFLSFFYSLFKLKIKCNEMKYIYYSTILIFLLSCLVDLPLFKDSTLSLFALILGITFTQTKYERIIQIE
jgi:O-antigen ligase